MTAHPDYPPIITLSGFHKCERPQDVVRFISRDHPAASILRAICLAPHIAFDVRELVNVAGFSTGHVIARVEFWLMRINDTLPRTGWEINSERRIQRISPQHENRLILKLGRAA